MKIIETTCSGEPEETLITRKLYTSAKLSSDSKDHSQQQDVNKQFSNETYEMQQFV